VAILALSVDRHARHVQDRAAKSRFVNGMVKKHLPVTKLVARNANKVHALFSCCSSAGYRPPAVAAAAARIARLSAERPSLAALADGRYKPPHPATKAHVW